MVKKWQQFTELFKINYEFNVWNKLKIRLDTTRRRPDIKEGQIWWCSMGRNIGVEINGKNAPFSRPVLVFHKFNKWSFLAIPLTTKIKKGSWYVEYSFMGEKRCANLAQIRVMSTFRLYSCMGEVSDKVMEKMCLGMFNLYLKDRLKKRNKKFPRRTGDFG